MKQSRLNIRILIEEDEVGHKDHIESLLKDLPNYCIKTFTKEVESDWWNGHINITDTSAPALAEGDFVDDVCIYFSTFLNLKKFNDAYYWLEIYVGTPHPNSFNLESHLLSILSPLECDIKLITENT